MAQLNITLNQDEILQLLSTDPEVRRPYRLEKRFPNQRSQNADRNDNVECTETQKPAIPYDGL